MDEDYNPNECHACQGRGYWIFNRSDPEGEYEKETCDCCEGLGYIRPNSVKFITKE